MGVGLRFGNFLVLMFGFVCCVCVCAHAPHVFWDPRRPGAGFFGTGVTDGHELPDNGC